MIALPDENEFFRELTPRICRHLEIESALRDSVAFLARFMPARKIYIEWYDRELGAVRTLASATPDEGNRIDRITPMSRDLRELIDTMDRSQPDTLAYSVNRPEQDPLSARMLAAFAEPPDTSLLVGLPAVTRRVLGAVILVADGRDRYRDEHVSLFAIASEPFGIALSNAMEHREVLRLKELLADDNRYLQRELFELSGQEIIGAEFGLANVMRAVRQVSMHDSPVLILGETGVGKDVIANAIHHGSQRVKGPFISVNCGAIPDSLIDSELFGHERGAFTGALSRKRGRFERAHHGTIFLDEVAELPAAAQVRLLRVLQSHEIERVGGTELIPVDIRVIAATNRSLQQRVGEGLFREDLWYRLNVVPIVVPPIRERRDDIPALVQHFLKKKAAELKLGEPPHVKAEMLDRLMAYDWPGNVRELENVIERALILGGGRHLSFNHLTLGMPQSSSFPVRRTGPDAKRLDEVISGHIRQVLSLTRGKIHGPGGAAEILGVNPSTLRNRMRKYGIPYGRRARKTP